MPNPAVAVCDGRVDVFADDAFDYLVVGGRLGASEDPIKTLRDLTWKVKTGGHVVFALPQKDLDPASRFKFTSESVTQLLESVGAWQLKACILRNDTLLMIAKKLRGPKGVRPIVRSTGRRACIVRYGALGDMVMITPLIRRLHEDGYAVTMNVTPYALPILENNPYVSNIVLQEREAIPNPDLGAYWSEWSGDYDRYINLSESIEGALLKVEWRKEFYTEQSWRHETCNKNYYDYTMQLGGYPDSQGTRGELFFTPQEVAEAKRFRKEHAGKFVVLWGLNGSSHHKIYPLAEPVAKQWLDSHPDAIIVTIGDAGARQYEFDHPQVISAAGQWDLRRTLAIIAHATDAIVGPESMAINVAGCYSVPKIPMLSHSSHENLCKYFEHDYCLEPDTSIAPCYPCHQLHYTAESCPRAEIHDEDTHELLTAGPVCAMGAISGHRVLARLDEVYQKHSGK